MWRGSSPTVRLAVALGLVGSASVSAQTETIEPIHWAYSAYFGTGRYSVDNGESAYVFSARPGRRWREPSLDEEGIRSIGIELRVPVTIGAHRFEPVDPGGTLRFDNVSTVSAVPGVEFEIPVTARWSLKPLIYAGWGTAIHDDSSAWIYWTGVKSRLRFHNESFDWALVNSLTYVGYSGDARHANVLPLLTGFEFDRPLAGKKLRGEQVQLHWHVAYTHYRNEIEWEPVSAALRPVEIADEWELGAAFSTGEQPLRWWRLHWDRVGIAYRFSSDGDFEGVSLVFRSLFDR